MLTQAADLNHLEALVEPKKAIPDSVESTIAKVNFAAHHLDMAAARHERPKCADMLQHFQCDHALSAIASLYALPAPAAAEP